VKDHTVSVTNLPSLVDSIATRIDDIDVLNQMWAHRLIATTDYD
jgi:hypothetical protein